MAGHRLGWLILLATALGSAGNCHAQRAPEAGHIFPPVGQAGTTSFGREVANAGPVNPAEIIGIGFMLSDKKPGPFRLEIESIQAVSKAP